MDTSNNPLDDLFTNSDLLAKIKKKLPYLFHLAELEASRAGKTGMQVGSLRENIIIALLIYKFGEENVETDIPMTEPEVDVKLFGRPVSIKTITGLGGVKAVWTVDRQKALEFMQNYSPKADILLTMIKWDDMGKFLYIPISVQHDVLNSLGRENYFKLPKVGTNPRGVEFSKEALLKIITHKNTKSVDVFWNRPKVDYDIYKRWIDLWREG